MLGQVKILVVGCGSVGTMYAFALHKSGLATVTVVLRSNFDSVNSQGFRITSIDHSEIEGWKPSNIEKTVEESIKHGPFDFVVVATKNLPDVYSIHDIIKPIITPGTTSIALVRNGIDIEQPFIDAFPENNILSCVPLIAPWPNPTIPKYMQQHDCRIFADMYVLGGAKCKIEDDITWQRWRKLIWNATFNTVCALTNLDSGTVQEASCLETLIRPAMAEIISIARAEGYEFPSDIQDQMIAFTPEEARLKPSMQVDAIRRRPMEIEVILGNPIRRAEALKIQTPVLNTLYGLLQAKQWFLRHV